MHTFSINDLILIILSSACFEHPSVHRQEVFCMQLYGIFQIYHKTACTSLPDDEHSVVRNMSKTV